MATRWVAGFLLICVNSLFVALHADYVIDNSVGHGRNFDGIGGLSGGGATSKLLVNYPEKERSEILDYLFKPNFGASLQILKVEIGGDSESTDGTEASHMHEPDDENYQRGYEWWLMTEAKKRNPNIKLFGLPWAFPGWLGFGKGSPYTKPNETANYIIKWIKAAKSVYNLDIDYIGIWNERPYDSTYIKTLRASLDQSGLQRVLIVAADGGWAIAKDMMSDAELYRAVQYVGVHYPGTKSVDYAKNVSRPLWSSEDYSTFNDNVGAGCWARILNQNYVTGLMTSTISWNLIAGYYTNLPFGRDGLMTAVEPWSGHYVVESPIWITAHTTQFTEIGWTYLKHGSGVGMLDDGGSYVALQSPDGSQFTLIIETMSHDHSLCIRPALPAYDVKPQLATFSLKGLMRNISSLNVWYSKLGFDGEETSMLMQKDPVQVVDGQFSVYLDQDEIYTFTTVDTGRKGDLGTPPSPKSFPLPYTDDFESYPEFSEAHNFVPQIGSFEIRDSKDAEHKMVNVQSVINNPIRWCGTSKNAGTLGGNYNWTDTSVSLDVYLPSGASKANGTFIGLRVNHGGCGTSGADGVFFWIYPSYGLITITTDYNGRNVKHQSSTSLGYDTWFTMGLSVKGDVATASLNGQKKIQIKPDSKLKNGFTMYGTANFGIAYFDNMHISAA